MAQATTAGISRTLAYRRFLEGRMIGMRTNRYSWWVHWKELADFFLPRRYKWIVTPNTQTRGVPLNQHILDSTGVIAARNCAAGLMSGKSSPTRPWLKLKIGRIDSTQTSPVSLWLKEVERLMYLIFHESNFYNSMAQFYYDLVVFGTAVIIIYEDFENVINCFNPCLGEYYVDIDGKWRPTILYREFTMTVSAVVDEFGYENCSSAIQALYDQPTGANLTRELVVAHAIEPNDDDRDFGIPKRFAFREAYWEWTGSTSPQGGASSPPSFLRLRGYHEQPHATVRWDIVSNDPYGRSPGMDALPDQKQLQLETRRKAQAIDKMVNPPLVADVQLKNQPASLLPGGMTYISGFAASGKAGITSVYETHHFPVEAIVNDLNEVKERLKKTFYNDLFQVASQFETRSNITAMEWDMRKSEGMVMLGPVISRLDNEGLKKIVERVYAIMSRANVGGQPLIPPPPPEIAGAPITMEFVSMLAQAQSAAEATSIERLLAMAGNIVGVMPGAMDNIDVDFALDKYGSLLNVDPKIIRSPEALAKIREMANQQAQQQQQAAIAEQLAKGAKTLSETDVGGGINALQGLVGAPV